MSKDPPDSGKTDPASNNKNPGHNADFEKKLPNGEQATEALLAKQVVEGVEGYFFKEKLKAVHKNLFEDSEKS